VKDKTAVFQALLRRHGLSPREVACVGDDASDRDLLRAAGFAATPSDGHPSLDAVTQYRSETKGGEGAVMEIIDLILEARSTSRQKAKNGKRFCREKAQKAQRSRNIDCSVVRCDAYTSHLIPEQ
jgi:3-deoxy-D-manno-octulosonate 8-phosphate phosphatase KdsC-like HAD superfamily phosphatase